jgi:UDP-N-acetylglucosamine 4,6-dehydratase/5-epimerase
MTREERAKAEDLGNYFRVAADNRDLNYNRYFSEGVEQPLELEDYNSHNTTRLDVAGMKTLLLELAEVREAYARRKA